MTTILSRLKKKTDFFFSIFLMATAMLSIGLHQSLWAKPFASDYLQFELPPGWDCVLEGAEWVCQSENEDRRKEAIIILVAKTRGDQDTLEEYLGYLKAAKTYSLPGGKTQVSEAKYAKMKEIGQQQWIDSLHLASEVPGFYTRYLATVKEDVGVAVTFSVSKEHYDSYQNVFEKVIETLRVFRQKKVDLAQYKLKGKDSNLLDSSMVSDEEGINLGQGAKAKRSTASAGGDNNMGLYLIIGLGLVAAFFLLKKKK
jgi:LPXTG-motif cell wall-anchored protein